MNISIANENGNNSISKFEKLWRVLLKRVLLKKKVNIDSKEHCKIIV
jgi:hypothetical protein